MIQVFTEDIAEKTIVHVFFKNMLIFKKQCSDTDSLKKYDCLTLLFRLNSFN